MSDVVYVDRVWFRTVKGLIHWAMWWLIIFFVGQLLGILEDLISDVKEAVDYAEAFESLLARNYLDYMEFDSDHTLLHFVISGVVAAVFVGVEAVWRYFITRMREYRERDGSVMADEASLDDMPMTSILQEWLNDKGREDEIELSEDRKTAKVSAAIAIGIDDVSCPFIFVIEEGITSVFLYFVPPIAVPPGRLGEALRMINRINWEITGGLTCEEGDEVYIFQYKYCMDVEGSMFSIKMIDNMFDAAVSALTKYHELLSEVALTDLTTEEIMEDAPSDPLWIWEPGFDPYISPTPTISTVIKSSDSK